MTNLLLREISNWHMAKRTHSKISFGTNLNAPIFLEGRNKICKGSSLSCCSLGFASYVGNSVRLENVKMGRFCSIGPNVTNILGCHPTHTFVSTHPSFFSTQRQVGFTFVDQQLFQEYKYANKERDSVAIGNDVWIGANAMLLEGITIGDGAIIGAGCVVSKSVEPYAIYAGNPQRFMRKRFAEPDIEKLLELRWWEKDLSWLASASKYFNNIRDFIENVR